MKHISRLLGTTAFSLCLALPAAADVTATQVWDNWKAAAQSAGQTMTVGSETQTGGTLSLSDVAIEMKTPEGTVNGTLAQITLAEQGDGTVLITTSAEYPLHIKMDPEMGESVDLTMLMSMPDLKTIASGDEETVRYAFDGPRTTATINGMMIDDEPVDMNIKFTLSALSGNYALTTGDTPTFDGTFNAAALTLDVAGQDSETPESSFTVSAEYSDLAVASSGTTSSLSSMADPAGMLADGARYDSTFTHDGGMFTISGKDAESGTFNLKSTADSGSLKASIANGTVEYLGGSKGLNITVSGSQVPFPELTAAMDEFAFGLSGPLTETDEPEDFGLLLNMANLTVGDALWSLVDPRGVLPHDPATVMLDLTGTAKMLVNFTDPGMLESADAPGELHSLNLNGLRVAVAGAELTGKGGFTFDNSDTETFGGLPAPDGAIDLKLVGGNGLLDKLVKMGLIPQDQASGAKMMMGLFAVPSGDDTLDSKIEVKPDGSISANGQRLK